MKRIAVLSLLLLLPLMTSACIVVHVPGDTLIPTPIPSSMTTADSYLEPTITPAYASSAPEAGTPEVVTSSTPAITSTPNSGPALYSSYAHMTAYHPASGIADFDYFDMLRDEDAVRWLVQKDGYSQTEAEDIVSEFADSEFIEKNESPQIRSIDLHDVELKLMFDADGDETLPDGPVSSSVAILNELYAHHPDLVTDIYFYYIKVQNGVAVSVTQIYWP